MLAAAQDGDDGAWNALIPHVYSELRRRAELLMRREGESHTLQPTALVNEAFMRLVGQDRAAYVNRAHFFAVASQAMRRVLVDHARSRQRQKRGGDRVRVSLEDFTPLSVSNDFDVLVVNDLLERLATLSERQARVVEMRFFGGLTMNEVADVLGVSLRTANGDWAVARAWMRRELTQ